jgi:competence protein ComEA
MRKRTGEKGFRFNLLLLVAGLVGLSLIFGGGAGYAQTKKALIDLNSASEKELESLKGIGPATAKKIIDGRPYKAVDDLKKAGLTEKTIEGIKPFVTVGPAKAAAPAKEEKAKAPAAPAKAPAKEEKAKAPAAPAKEPAKEPAAKAQAKAAPAAAKLAPGQKVNLNTATKAQLEALPEIGPVKAQEIIDGRPYKKTEDVMKVKGIKEGIFGKIKDLITVD